MYRVVFDGGGVLSDDKWEEIIFPPVPTGFVTLRRGAQEKRVNERFIYTIEEL